MSREAVPGGEAAHCNKEPQGEKEIVSHVVAEMALAGNLGASVNLDPLTPGGLSNGTLLFAESPSRFLVEVAPEDSRAFEAVLAGAPLTRVGDVTDDGLLTVTAGGQSLLRLPVERLSADWRATLADEQA